MKKYKMLADGEYTQAGDQFLHTHGGEWREMEVDYQVTWREEGYIRRPIPYEGKVAFLVTYSPMIRVVIDTTGLSDEEIDNKLAQAAQAEFCYNHAEHMNNFHDNIDWGQTKEDLEVPFVEPEPKTPDDYRMLEMGDIIQSDDEYLFPEGWQLIPSIMVGDEFNADCDAQSVRRPITEPRYRPFKEGDVIEEGDQFLYKGEWDSFSSLCYGEEINAQYIPTSRKLIN